MVKRKIVKCFLDCLMEMLFLRPIVMHHILESCLVIPVDQQLLDKLNEGGELTLTAWFQSLTVDGAVSGTVVSLSSVTRTSTVYYLLGFVQLDNGTTAVQFSFQVTHLHWYLFL